MKTFLQTIMFACLFFACSLPAVGGFSDELVVPKWYAATFMGILIASAYCWGLIGHAQKSARPFFTAVILVGVAECVYALIMEFLYGNSLGIGAMGTFDNPAGLALSACLCMPFAFALIICRRHWAVLVLGIFVMGLLITAVIMSKSRTGMIASGVMLVTLCLLAGGMSARAVAWKTALCLTVVASVAWYTISRKGDSTDGRRFILERTWELIAEKPLAGHGHGGFNREYMAIQAEFFRHNPDSKYGVLADEVRHPLNEFAKVWVEHGVCAPILLIAVMAVPFIILWKRRTVVSRVIAMSVVPVAVFTCFSYPFNYPAAWVMVAVANGMAFAPMFLKVISGSRMRVCMLGMRIFLIAAFIMLVDEYRHEHEWYVVSKKAARGYSGMMMPRYEKLYQHYSGNPYFLYNYMAEQYFAGRFEAALITSEECRKLWSGYNLELMTGDICRKLGRNNNAIRHYKEAGYMCPSRFAPLEGLFYAYMAEGDTVSALATAKAIENKEMKVVSADALRIKREVNGLGR